MPLAHHIEIRPSGRRFEAQANDSILEAGLRAGCNLSHRCSNGTCGDCRVRIVSGKIEQFRHHDFHIPQAEKEAGMVLACCNRALSDAVVEVHEIGSTHEVPEQQIVARVARLEPLSGGVTLLRVRTPRSQTLQFLAGQELELGFIGQRQRRAPIASCPCDGMNLRFHVSTEHGGKFGAFVADKLERNAQVILRGPKGEFVLDESSPRPLLLVAWGTGFASAESILEHAFSLELPQPMFLYWVSETADGHYLLNQCRAWEDALDNFRFHCLASVPANDFGLQLLAERIQQDLGRVEGYDVYAMVPPALLESVRRALGALGASESLLRFSTASL